MGNLQNKRIKDSYGGVLHTTDDTGLSGTDKSIIQDGNGVDTSLKLSTEKVDVDGDLQTGGVDRITETGELVNVSGDISQLTNDSGYLTDIPADVIVDGDNNSRLTNDSGYLTSIPADVMREGENVSLLTNDAGYITSGTIPSNVMVEGDNNSLLTNDSGYLTELPDLGQDNIWVGDGSNRPSEVSKSSIQGATHIADGTGDGSLKKVKTGSEDNTLNGADNVIMGSSTDISSLPDTQFLQNFLHTDGELGQMSILGPDRIAKNNLINGYINSLTLDLNAVGPSTSFDVFDNIINGASGTTLRENLKYNYLGAKNSSLKGLQSSYVSGNQIIVDETTNLNGTSYNNFISGFQVRLYDGVSDSLVMGRATYNDYVSQSLLNAKFSSLDSVSNSLLIGSSLNTVGHISNSVIVGAGNTSNDTSGNSPQAWSDSLVIGSGNVHTKTTSIPYSAISNMVMGSFNSLSDNYETRIFGNSNSIVGQDDGSTSDRIFINGNLNTDVSGYGQIVFGNSNNFANADGSSKNLIVGDSNNVLGISNNSSIIGADGISLDDVSNVHVIGGIPDYLNTTTLNSGNNNSFFTKKVYSDYVEGDNLKVNNDLTLGSLISATSLATDINGNIIAGSGGGGGGTTSYNLQNTKPIWASNSYGKTWKMTHMTTGYSTQNYNISSGTEFMVIPFTEVEGRTIKELQFEVNTGQPGATTNIHLYKAYTTQDSSGNDVLDGVFVDDLALNIDCSSSGMKEITGVDTLLPATEDGLYFFLYRMSNGLNVGLAGISNSQIVNPNNSVFIAGPAYRIVTWQSGGDTTAPTNLLLGQNMSASTGAGLIRTFYTIE